MAVEQDRQGEMHWEQALLVELGYVLVWHPEEVTHWEVAVLRKLGEAQEVHLEGRDEQVAQGAEQEVQVEL